MINAVSIQVYAGLLIFMNVYTMMELSFNQTEFYNCNIQHTRSQVIVLKFRRLSKENNMVCQNLDLLSQNIERISQENNMVSPNLDLLS